jgi:anti-sigma factor RsiW
LRIRYLGTAQATAAAKRHTRRRAAKRPCTAPAWLRRAKVGAPDCMEIALENMPNMTGAPGLQLGVGVPTSARPVSAAVAAAVTGDIAGV